MSDLILESAPSNIALIKYMGKKNVEQTSSSKNIPTNTSLSYTLSHLKSWVQIEQSNSAQNSWEPLKLEGFDNINLSDFAKERFLSFFNFLCEEFEIQGHYSISSNNEFPSDCGIASSASSFAALTRAVHSLGVKVESKKSLEINSTPNIDSILSGYSKLGSGSSCRSFFKPWSSWDENGAKAFDNPNFENLNHIVVIADNTHKKISSSKAHQMVRSSLLFSDRVERAEKRFNSLTESFQKSNWKNCFEICWAEFWDMHALFETSTPSFGYITPSSLEILSFIKNFWEENLDGPIVTMDAGPNVHLLFRKDQIKQARAINKSLNTKFKTYINFEKNIGENI